MTINHDIPFVSNDEDDMHCFQASLSMIIQYFRPDEDISFEKLDKKTDHLPGHGTWPLQGLQFLRSLGIDVSIITPFDYEKFVEQGVEYIRAMYGDEIAQWQDENNDLSADQEKIKKLLPTARIENRNPTYNDILSTLEKYPVMCSIDSSITRGELEYTGHFVVIRGYDDKGLFLNDPGLPPRENVHVPKGIFEKAWDSFSSADSRFLYPVVGVSEPKKGLFGFFKK